MTTPFVIPHGLRIEQTHDGIIIEHDGDITIQSSLHTNIAKIISHTGNIQIDIQMHLGEIIAPQGSVTINKSLTVQKIDAQSLYAQTTLSCTQQLQISEKIEVHGHLKGNVIRCNGDIHINGLLDSRQLYLDGSIHASGSIHSDYVYCGGDAHISDTATCKNIELVGSNAFFGAVETNELIAKNAHLQILNKAKSNITQTRSTNLSGELHIKTLHAQGVCTITDSHIQSDIVICQKAEISNSNGKIIIVDAQEIQGQHNVKGCLDLQDFMALVPNIDEFLASRGLDRSMLQHTPSSKISTDSITTTPPVESVTTLHKLTIDLGSSNNATISYSQPVSILETEDISTISSMEPNDTYAEMIAREQDFFHDTQPEDTQDTENSLFETDNTPLSIDTLQGSLNFSIDALQEDIALSETNNIEESVIDNFDDLTSISTETEYNISTETEYTIDSTPSEPNEQEQEMVAPDQWVVENILDGEEEIPVDQDVDEVVYDDTPLTTTASTIVQELYVSIRTEIIHLAEAYPSDKPEAIQALLEYNTTQEYLDLRDEINKIWTKLLTHHQKNNSRFPPMASEIFNKLNQHLQQLSLHL